MSSTRLSISLSGPDNIGKTTLINLIPRSWPITIIGPIHEYNDSLASMVNSQDDTFKGWWFGNSNRMPESDEGFVKMMAQSCTARHAAATLCEEGTTMGQVDANGVPVNLPGSLLDRSSIMFEAVCSARIATVRCLPLDEAERRVQSILADIHTFFPSETISIVLQRKGSMKEAAEECLRCEGKRSGKTPDDQYITYQHHLHQAIDRQIRAGRYTALVPVDYGEPFTHILTKIVNVIRQIVAPNTLFPHLLSGVKCIVALGGLSECGKSTTATSLVYRHNQRSASAFSMLELGRQSGAFRMKTIYLEGLATTRIGQSVYSLGANKWALEVIHELDRFARIHKYLEVITIESMHDLGFAKRLQELIGSAVLTGGERSRMMDSFRPPKLLLVYMDTPLALRRSRTNAQGGGTVFDEKKDQVKRARGAHEIKDIADLVCENVGTQEETCEEVEKMISSYLVEAA